MTLFEGFFVGRSIILGACRLHLLHGVGSKEHGVAIGDIGGNLDQAERVLGFVCADKRYTEHPLVLSTAARTRKFVEISAARGTFKVIHRLLHMITVVGELKDDLFLIMVQPNYVSIELTRRDREAAA